jgi:TonB-dependent Receptor Plug Domain
MKNLKIISLGIAMLISFVAIGQDIKVKEPVKLKTTTKNISTLNRTSHIYTYKKKNHKPLVIIDGKIKSLKYIKKIKPENIESVEVIKDSASIKKYGRKGKFGVILIKIKKSY